MMHSRLESLKQLPEENPSDSFTRYAIAVEIAEAVGAARAKEERTEELEELEDEW